MKKESAPCTPFRLFLLFSRINALTLGGGYVIVPVTANSLDRKGWMKESEFYDIFARAQAFPGPLALSSAILSAKTLCGVPGAVAAFFGVIIPPFVALILVSGILGKVGSLAPVQRFLDGAGAVVPGLVAAMLWKTASRRAWNPGRIAETLILALALVLLPSYSLPILLAGIFLFYGVETKCRSSK